MSIYYDSYSQFLSSEIPLSKNSSLKRMLNLDKFEIGQSYVTCKLRNRENNTVMVNIQGGSPGMDLSDSLFNLSDIPQTAYIRILVDNKVLIRKLPILGVKDWLLIYENTLFTLSVKDKYNELEIICVF